MTWLKHHLPHLACILGFLLIVAGVSAYSWQAGLIVAGLGLSIEGIDCLRHIRKREQDE